MLFVVRWSLLVAVRCSLCVVWCVSLFVVCVLCAVFSVLRVISRLESCDGCCDLVFVVE